MESIIYTSSCGEGMTKDNLMDYLKSFSIINPQYKDWDFDAITGGITEFISPVEYVELKKYHENLK